MHQSAAAEKLLATILPCTTSATRMLLLYICHQCGTHLALQDEAQVLAGSPPLAGQHLMLHPVHGARKPADELLQLRGPQPEEGTALVQPVADEPARASGNTLSVGLVVQFVHLQ
jgi:hypothetical protein